MSRFLEKYKGLPKEIYIIFLARVINSVGAFVYPLLTLIMTDKIGLSSSDAGLFMTILLLTQGPVMLIGGKLADKYGRVKLIIVFQILGALTYTVCGLIEMSMSVVYLIVLASNFYAVTYPAMDALTADLTHTGNRKEAFALLYMGFNLGFAIGPMLGGLLYKSLLPLIFIGDAATTILSTVLICIFVKETLPDKARGDMAARQNQMERYEEGSLFRVLKERKFILLFAFILFIYEFAYSQWAFALPLDMKALFANGAGDYGMLASFNGLLVILFTPFIAWLIQKWRLLHGMALGGALFALSFFMLIFARDLIFFYLSVFVLTMGEVISTIDSRAFLANYSPSSHRARLNSLVNILSGSGKAISPLVIGQVITGSGIKTGWTVISLSAIFGAALLFGLIQIKPVKNEIKGIGHAEN